MDLLIYFSSTNETKKVNDYFKDKLPNFKTFNITNYETRSNFNFQLIYNIVILSVPVYSENIPLPVRKFLSNIQCKYIIINLTYGSITPGNALYKVKKLLSSKTIIIGASLIPSKHSYSNNLVKNEFNKLDILIDKAYKKEYTYTPIPKLKGHILAPFLEKIRTKYNVKIIHDSNKCIKCNLCIGECPVKAINHNYQLDKNCLRCLRCVYICPNNAFTIIKSKILSFYIKKHLKKQSIRIFK